MRQSGGNIYKQGTQVGITGNGQSYQTIYKDKPSQGQNIFLPLQSNNQKFSPLIEIDGVKDSSSKLTQFYKQYSKQQIIEILKSKLKAWLATDEGNSHPRYTIPQRSKPKPTSQKYQNQDKIAESLSSVVDKLSENDNQILQREHQESFSKLWSQFVSRENANQVYQKITHDVNTMKLLFQRQTLPALKQSWNERGKCLFRQLFLFADPLQPSEDIRSLIQTVQFRMFKKQTFFERMFPGITKTTLRIAQNLNIPTLDALFEEFKRKEQNSLQVNQYKLSYYFLEQYKQKHQISVEKDQTKIDNILFSYIDESRRNREGRKVDFQVKHNGEKVSIKKFIAEFPLLSDGTPVLLNYLHTIKHSTRNQKQNIRELSLERIATQTNTSCYRCLGCTSWFELNASVNMDEIGQSPFIVIPTIVNSMNSDLANFIIALLNSGGGLILFDMKSEYRDVFPLGAIIDEEKKDSIRAEFTEILRKIMYFESFRFISGMDDLVEIDFVPVKAAREDNFIDGRYITRIRVCPQDSTLVFYKENKQTLELESFYREPNGSIQAIKPLQIKKIMKRKIRAFHSKTSNLLAFHSKTFDLLARKPQNYFQHKCPPPEKGNPTRSLRQQREGEDMMMRQRGFKSMSIIVCKDSIIKIIKENLFQKKIPFSIDRLFQKQKFGVAKYTAILYHNFDSRKDVECILEKEIEESSKSKKMIIIDVTRHLLVKQRSSSNPFSKEELRNFKEMFKKQFQKEAFKLYQYRQCKKNVMKDVYYIETESKTSIVFLYYLLNHLNTRVMMIEPWAMRNLPMEDIESKRKLIYSSAELQ